MITTRQVLPPVELKAEKVEPGGPELVPSTKGYYPSLVWSDLKAEFPQPQLQGLVESLGISLVLERADKIICVSNEARLPFTMGLDHRLEPQIQRVVQVHIGQYRRNDPTLGCSRGWVYHLPVR